MFNPHTSWISCSSDNWRWRLSDSSTSLLWSTSSLWAKRPRISSSSLRVAAVCWLSAFSWAWELSFALAAWRERAGGRKQMKNDKWGGGRWCTKGRKKKANNNDEQKRKNNSEKEGEKHVQCSSGTDSKMLALSSLIRDNGQVCSRQIASNTLALTGICKDFASVQNLII